MIQKRNIKFNLETPFEKKVSSPFIISGWVIVPDNFSQGSNSEVFVEIYAKNRLLLKALVGNYRKDVFDAFGGSKESLNSGFGGEVILDDYVGERMSLTVVVSDGSLKKETIIENIDIEVCNIIGKEDHEDKKLLDIIACPVCQSIKIKLKKNLLLCDDCGSEYNIQRGVPIFSPKDEAVQTKILEQGSTNPCAEDVVDFIKKNRDKMILNFGAGNPTELVGHNNIIFHEVIQYRSTDVVSIYNNLPYKDNSFDFIFSLAVFEHLKNPKKIADELFRVLKPGGRIYIETAFMQPYHSDPYHYFNMTLPGIREIFRNFYEVNSGFRDHQKSSYGIKMLFNSLIPYCKNKYWKDSLQDFMKNMDKYDFDKNLYSRGALISSAGVFFDGIKK